MSDTPIKFEPSKAAVVRAHHAASSQDTAGVHQMPDTTSIIDFHSQGHGLILTHELDAALQLAEKLSISSTTVVQVDPSLTAIKKKLTDSGITVFSVPSLELNGYLGAFSATVNLNGIETNLAVSVYLEKGLFDTVVDLLSKPLMAVQLPPLGYYCAQTDEGIKRALDEIPDLMGEFEKPKYFRYNSAICAHSRSQLQGCNNCISVCATGAIQSLAEGIEVNPFLCQGCGSCATVCPSGAISYAYPPSSQAIRRTREQLQAADNRVLLLYTESQQAAIDALPTEISSQVLSLEVEEVSAFGMDYWASMLCSGVHKIVLCDLSEEQSRQALLSQMAIFHELLAGLGVTSKLVQLLNIEALAESDTGSAADLLDLQPVAKLLGMPKATFATQDDKRQTLRTALDYLAGYLQPVESIVKLSSHAPFGVINVDTTACTLCMACVSVCPAKSLLDGQSEPALRQIEANCLQCGLCEQACPESAITSQARYQFDSIAARKINTLHEEAAFNCVRCHKPFATASLINNLFAKLEGHWMFTDDAAKRRLKMCEDCRVVDMFEHDQSGIDVHRPK